MFIQTRFRRSLNHNTVYFTEFIIIRYIRSSTISSQNIKHIVWSNTGTLTFGCIYIHRYLWKIHSIRAISHSNFRTLIQSKNKLIYRVIKRFHLTTGLIFHIEFNSISCSISRNHGRLETEYLCFFDNLLCTHI